MNSLHIKPPVNPVLRLTASFKEIRTTLLDPQSARGERQGLAGRGGRGQSIPDVGRWLPWLPRR